MSKEMQGDGGTDYVDEILMELSRSSARAKKRFALFPRMPRGLPEELKSLWADVGFCFTFRRDYAALCVCGAFVEYFLERSIVDFEEKTGRTRTSLPSALYGLIERAAEIGLVSDEERKMLQHFRAFIRNLYCHGDVGSAADLFSSIKGAEYIRIEGGEIKIERLTEIEVEQLRRATVKERLHLTTKKFAEPAIRWIGQWARECAAKVYEAPA